MTAAAPAGPICRILLIRHASAARRGCLCGHTNVRLARGARHELPTLARKVARYAIDAFYSSDLIRARRTATAIARPWNAQVIVRRALREIDFGPWEGLSWRQVTQRFPELSRAWLRGFPTHPIPGGEPFTSFRARVEREMMAIVTAHRGGCVAVVTHAGVVRLVLGSALGVSDGYLFRMAVDPAGLSVIDVFEKGAVVQLMNG